MFNEIHCRQKKALVQRNLLTLQKQGVITVKKQSTKAWIYMTLASSLTIALPLSADNAPTQSQVKISREETSRCAMLFKYIQQTVNSQFTDTDRLEKALKNFQDVFVVENLTNKVKLKEASVKLDAYLKKASEEEVKARNALDQFDSLLERSGLNAANIQGLTSLFQKSKKDAVDSYQKLHETQANLQKELSDFLAFLASDTTEYHVIDNTVIFDEPFPTTTSQYNQTSVLPPAEDNIVAYRNYVKNIQTLIKTYGEDWNKLLDVFKEKQEIAKAIGC